MACGGFFMALGLAPAQAEPPPKKLSETLENLAASKETEASLKQKLEKTESDLNALQERATDLAKRLQESEERVSSLEGNLAEINVQLAEKQKDFNARKADYSVTIVSLLRMRELPSSALFTNPSDIEALLKAASVLEVTNRTVAAKTKVLRDDLVELKKLKAESGRRTTRTRREQESLAQAQETLTHAMESRKKLQMQLSEDHERAEEKVAMLSRESQSLQELIRKLEKPARTIQPKHPAAKKPTTGTPGVASNGNLRSPVVGEVIHHFGERKNANETYRGMVFKARRGATVVAPLDGEIVFTGPFRDYGNMVLVKHSSGYISLIAGLGQVSATLNQKALRGEPIGAVASQGMTEVYVELRDPDAKPIDPASWFAKVGRVAASP